MKPVILITTLALVSTAAMMIRDNEERLVAGVERGLIEYRNPSLQLRKQERLVQRDTRGLIGLRNQGIRKQELDTMVLYAMRDREARLPCGRGKVILDGTDAYVAWMRNSVIVYKHPNKDYEMELINPERIVETPCNPGSCRDPANLLLKKVSDEEAGLYICRVHYQTSPSVDHLVELRIVDTPDVPDIYINGNKTSTITVGPLSVGSDVRLSCEIPNKDPEFEVYWRRSGAIVETTNSTRTRTVIRADLLLTNLTREDDNSHFECLSQAGDVSEPLIRSIVIRMILVPLAVHIRLDGNYKFEAGVPRVVTCIVQECYPTPFVGWFLGDDLLTPTSYQQTDDGKATISTLTLTASLENSHQELKCRAHNVLRPTEHYEDRVKILVGIVPKCVTSRVKLIGIVETEQETVTCPVLASPKPTKFTWVFANNRTVITNTTVIGNNRYASNLTWIPHNADFGPLQCRATNSFGTQRKPCFFNVTQGGPPEAPACDISRGVPTDLNVHCRLGWDGGRDQTVTFELLNESGEMLRNISDPIGLYFFKDLPERRNFTAIYYASNSRGKSEENRLELKSFAVALLERELEIEREKEKNAKEWATLPYLVTITGMGMISIVMAVKAIRAGCCTVRGSNSENSTSPDLVPRHSECFHREPNISTEEDVENNEIELSHTPYCSPVVRTRRVFVGCPDTPPDEGVVADNVDDSFSSSQESFFV